MSYMLYFIFIHFDVYLHFIPFVLENNAISQMT